MSEHKSHFRLGLFVLTALLLCAGLAIGLGAKKWFTSYTLLETYFDESVQGIDIGSKIRYRGVVVGEVSELGFTHSVYEQDKPLKDRYQYVLVRAKIRPEAFGGPNFSRPEQTSIDQAVARGLRIKITPQGLTGTSYLEIDYAETGENPILSINWKPEGLYIPSTRSTVKQFVTAFQDTMVRLQRIDIESTLSRVNRLLDTSERKIDALPLERIGLNVERFSNELARAPVGRMASEAASLLAEARESNRNLQKLLTDPALASAPADIATSARRARELLEDPALKQSVTHLNQSLGRIDRLLSSREQDLSTLISNLDEISTNLKALSVSAQQHPAGLLFGTPPKPYEPPR